MVARPYFSALLFLGLCASLQQVTGCSTPSRSFGSDPAEGGTDSERGGSTSTGGSGGKGGAANGDAGSSIVGGSEASGGVEAAGGDPSSGGMTWGSAGQESGGETGLGGAAPTGGVGGSDGGSGDGGIGGDSSTSVCGNGTTEAGESCDDGNKVTEACAYGQSECLVCNASCALVAGALLYCGDGTRDTTREDCDDGNKVTEACEYGKTSCTVCDASCKSVAGAISYCGDGTRQSGNGETCDDGNAVTERCTYGLTSCSVCDATCKSVAGATSYCGNGSRDAANGEACDDGNTVLERCTYGLTSCSVCDATCKTVAGATSYCGNGSRDAANGETCDDGNSSNLDSCSTSCKACANLPGLTPASTVSNTGWANSGLALTATANATLYQFAFHHQGKADTVTFATSAGAVIGTVAVAAGAANPLVLNVNWQLTANTTYTLTNALGDNEYYASAPTGTFPVAAAGGIRVDSGWIPMYPHNNPNYWVTFSNLRSCIR